MTDMTKNTSPDERDAQLIVNVTGVGAVKITGKLGLVISEGPGQTKATQDWCFVLRGELCDLNYEIPTS